MSSTDDRHGDDQRENALAAAWTKNHPTIVGVVHARALLDPEVPTCRGDLGEGDELSNDRSTTCPDCLDVFAGKWIKSIRTTERRR